MVQHATSMIRNVKGSIEKSVYDNLKTTESINIDFEAFPFESGATSITEWIQLRIMDVGDPSWKPRAGSSSRGNMAPVMVSFNCFVNKENVVLANGHYRLRDVVNKYYYSGASIPLRDYVGGTTQPWTCLMTVRDIITDMPIPNEDLNHYNYTISLEYLREWED